MLTVTCLTVLYGMAFFDAAAASPNDPIKNDLNLAKEVYQIDVEEFGEAVTSWLDKREQAALKTRSQRLVAQVKAERQTFLDANKLPRNTPAEIRLKLLVGRAAMEAAYGAAVKAYTQAKRPDEAATVEKELQAFKAAEEEATGWSDVVFLSDLVEASVSASEFDKHCKSLVNGVPTPNGIFLHPTSNSYSRVLFLIGRQFREFDAGVAVRDGANGGAGSGSPLTFQVWGDRKLLWQSEPVQKCRVVQTCAVRVSGVSQLELRVVCHGDSFCAHAVWIEPRLK